MIKLVINTTAKKLETRAFEDIPAGQAFTYGDCTNIYIKLQVDGTDYKPKFLVYNVASLRNREWSQTNIPPTFLGYKEVDLFITANVKEKIND